MTQLLNSLGVFRKDELTRTHKLCQFVESPSWEEVKTKLEELSRTGLLTLKAATKTRLELQWTPQVFPQQEVKPLAKQAFDTVVYDLTLAFKELQDRDDFADWLTKSSLLT